MNALPRSLLLSFYILLLFWHSNCFLDIDEIKNVHYGLELLKTPVVLSQEASYQMVLLSTIHGQKYRCNFPDHSTTKEEAEGKEAGQIGVPDLLKPMEDGPCVITTKDWWTYEFCYGKYIQQYHMEDGVPVGKVIYLGFYESEYNWNEGGSQEARQNKERLNRYHSQQYVNGTVCDLTNKPRRVEVRFLCDEGSGDYIARIDEPESCVYVVTIHTTKICHHPYLKPLSPTKPLPIMCNPVLDAEQYQEYLDVQEAERLREEAFIREQNKYSAEANEVKPDGKDAVGGTQSAGGTEKRDTVEGDLGEGKDKVDVLKKLKDAMVNSVKNGVGGANKGTDGDDLDIKLHFKVVKSTEDMEKLMKELQNAENNLENDEQDDLPPPRYTPPVELMPSDDFIDKTPPADSVKNLGQNVAAGQTQNYNTRRAKIKTQLEKFKELINGKKKYKSKSGQDVPSDDEDHEILQEFDDGVEQLKKDGHVQEKMSSMSSYIRNAMSDEFKGIVDEAQDELRREGFNGPIDRKQAFVNLASTLDKLMSRLEKSNQKLDEVDKRLREAADSAKKSLLEQRKKSAELLEKIMKKSGRKSPVSRPVNEKEDASVEKLTDTQAKKDDNIKPNTDDDNRIKVRVTKVKFKDPADTVEKPDSQGDTKVVLGEVQKQKLENSVREELKKAGLDKSGRKIHVKIITSVPTDGKDFQSLSEEDSAAFNKMIVTILGGNQDELREAERQQQMEDNYHFVYKPSKKKKTEGQSIP